MCKCAHPHILPSVYLIANKWTLQDPGTEPARRLWTSLNVGTEIYVSRKSETAQWSGLVQTFDPHVDKLKIHLTLKKSHFPFSIVQSDFPVSYRSSKQAFLDVFSMNNSKRNQS
ncbi:hypothetical protein AMTRI_Chr11g158010 [Amborella trichopoda]